MIVCLIIIITIIIICIIAYLLYTNSSNGNKNQFNHMRPPYNGNMPYSGNMHKNHFTNMPYSGNIDNDINEINNNLVKNYKYNVAPPINLKSGHPELKKNENANAPKGNPFNRTNISAPYATPTMVTKELNADTLDFDEKNANLSLMRNDPYRPINGIMNRESWIDPFLREELKSEENKEWWGAGEY